MTGVSHEEPVLVIDQRDPIVTLNSIAARLMANLTAPLDLSLPQACAEIGHALDAELVTYRRIENDTAHFVAGWAPGDPDLVALPLSVPRDAHLPREPMLAYAPIYLLPEPLELPVGLLDDAAAATLPRLAVPALVDDTVCGYLHLTLGAEARVSDTLRASLTMLANLFHQIRRLSIVGDDRRLQSRMDRVLRQTAIDFLELAPGEEGPAIDAAIGSLGRALQASHITYWDVDLSRSCALRSHRWVADGSSVPEILSEDPMADNAAIRVFDHLDEADNLGRVADSGVAEVVIDVGCHTILTPLVAPGRLGRSLRGALVISRPVAEPWTAWERDAITTFTAMIPQIRSRMETEAQVMASFYDAPVGITLVSDDGEVLDCNQSFLDFLGLDDERSVLRTNMRELIAYELLSDEAIDELDAPTTEGVRGRELPYRHGDGTVVWGRLSTSPIPSGKGTTWLIHVEDITAVRAERERDRERATRDALTGLPNRHELFDAMQLRGSDPYTLMMLDLDGFKAINDEHGHLVGDELLATIGLRLCDSVRSGDLIGRFGGDEFVAILAGHHDDAVLEIQLARLRGCITDPVETSVGTLAVGVSIGVARSRDGEPADQVMARADAAMYAQKHLHAERTGSTGTHQTTHRISERDTTPVG